MKHDSIKTIKYLLDVVAFIIIMIALLPFYAFAVVTFPLWGPLIAFFWAVNRMGQ